MNDEPKTPPRTGQGMDYGEQADVQQVHAAVQREKREPRVGAEPLSIWLIAIYGLAIFFGGAYLGRYSGNFTSGGLDPMGSPPAPKKAVSGGPAGGEQAELSPHDRGKKIFAANCQTCHQANGLGVPGQYPPLAGSEFTNGGSRRMGMIVLKGLQGPVTVKGQQYGTAVMQPWDKTLTDQKIADVMTYERSEWGNNASPLTFEKIPLFGKSWPIIPNHSSNTISSQLLTKIFPAVRLPAVHRRNPAKPQNPRRHQNRSASFSLQRFCKKLGHVFWPDVR